MYSVFGKNNAFKTLWELISPLFIYYVGYYVAYFLIIMTLSGNGITQTPDYANALVGGICMLGGLIALWNQIQQECQFSKFKQPTELQRMSGKHKVLSYVVLVTCAISLVVIMNHIMYSIGMTSASDSYQKVAENQYAVPVWMGIVLYGVVAPLAEETVFRFLIFNRLTRSSGRVVYGVFVSAFLFGVYHGNLVQGTYSFIVGVFLAYAYHRFGKIWAPIFCHGIGNIVIYICSVNANCYKIVFGTAGIIVWSVLLITILYAEWKHYKKTGTEAAE